MRQVVQKGNLGEAVKDFAAAQGISISTLEREAGYSPGMISRWISAGEEDYNALSKLVTMADLLDISLDELVGRKRESLQRGGADSSASRLEVETRTKQLTWSAWRPDGTPAPIGSMPVHKSGRLCCGGWWTQRNGLRFVLALFCDDSEDEDEPMELGLYCTPGHKLPLFPVPDASSDTLSALYTQILLVDTLATDGRCSTHAVLALDAQESKTLPLRILNG